MQLNDDIVRWVDAHREEFLQDLRTLCRIRSVSSAAEEGAPFGPGPRAALEAAMDLCRGYGFDVQNHADRVMTADFGQPQGRALDILAHLDVVGEGDGWDSDPYEPLIRDDGYIYGRGVADDKGGVVAALYALRCVKELGLPLKHGCRLIFGTDEENGSGDVEYYYKHESPAPNTFTPDAEFPLCNAEKGFFRLNLREVWHDQPDALPRVVLLHGGFRVNVIPGTASADILGIQPVHLMAGASPLCAELGASCEVEEIPGGARLIVNGEGCHAASPELGCNANTALLHVLAELPLAYCPSTQAILALDHLLPHGDYYGRALGIEMEDEKTGKLTCSFTQIDMTPEGLTGLCDCRVPLCATAENCANVAEDQMALYGIEAAGMIIPPHYTPAEGDFIQTLLGCYETVTGQPGACYHMGGGTYVHDVPGGVAFGYAMPGIDVRMHAANERYPVEDLFTSTKIFAHAIVGVCAE